MKKKTAISSLHPYRTNMVHKNFFQKWTQTKVCLRIKYIGEKGHGSFERRDPIIPSLPGPKTLTRSSQGTVIRSPITVLWKPFTGRLERLPFRRRSPDHFRDRETSKRVNHRSIYTVKSPPHTGRTFQIQRETVGLTGFAWSISPGYWRLPENPLRLRMGSGQESSLSFR